MGEKFISLWNMAPADFQHCQRYQGRDSYLRINRNISHNWPFFIVSWYSYTIYHHSTRPRNSMYTEHGKSKKRAHIEVNRFVRKDALKQRAEFAECSTRREIDCCCSRWYISRRVLGGCLIVPQWSASVQPCLPQSIQRMMNVILLTGMKCCSEWLNAAQLPVFKWHS